ncbi:DUF86 domain-containing protein [Thioalkalivibrio sulfidiphilus]|uniref:HepT-like ribonuclease domain-containing protein n=1 Tax=Thioalkalivibrio sulfidiphilus TaxID=1033854 RepID=UPI003B32BC45
MRLDQDRLLDILEAIEAIERHKPEDKDQFDADELIRVWCLRHLEVIGEAATKISEDCRILAPEIPWRQVIGMRNALIHAYFDVDWNEVWLVVTRDLPSLKANAQALLLKVEKDQLE